MTIIDYKMTEGQICTIKNGTMKGTQDTKVEEDILNIILEAE